MRNKSVNLNIRLSKEELDQIKAKAADKHLTVSSYVRMTVLSGGRDNDRA